MSLIEIKEHKTTFEVPDKISVQTRMQWESLFGAAVLKQDGTAPLLTWEACKKMGLIENWQSEVLPDYRVNLAEEYDPDVADLVVSAAMKIVRTMQDRRLVKKNS